MLAMLQEASAAPAAAPPTMEQMSVDRHILQVQELSQQRRAAGQRPCVRCTFGRGDGAASRVSKVLHFVRHGQAAHNALSAAVGAAPCGCKRSRQP